MNPGASIEHQCLAQCLTHSRQSINVGANSDSVTSSLKLNSILGSGVLDSFKKNEVGGKGEGEEGRERERETERRRGGGGGKNEKRGKKRKGKKEQKKKEKKEMKGNP